jgi:hypothetical protein
MVAISIATRTNANAKSLAFGREGIEMTKHSSMIAEQIIRQM